MGDYFLSVLNAKTLLTTRTYARARAVEGQTLVTRLDATRRTAGALGRALRERGVAFDYLTTARGVAMTRLDEETSLDAFGVVDGSTVHARARVLGGHCQVPCGIFDDPAMVASLREMSATVRKAMTQINEIAAGGLSDPVKLNQSMRWVMTKEEHCSKIITTVAEYCLCQRVKTEVFANDAEYVQALKAHHEVMQHAMKCKQNTDTDFCVHLDHALDDMCAMYIK